MHCKPLIIDYVMSAEFVQVLENLESPGILLWHFPMVRHSFQNYNRICAGFSAAYTSLHMLRMGFKLIYIQPFRSRIYAFVKGHTLV